MKADVDRAKQAALLGEEYNPAIPGVGAAWSHNFLNQVQSSLHGFMMSHVQLLLYIKVVDNSSGAETMAPTQL